MDATNTQDCIYAQLIGEVFFSYDLSLKRVKCAVFRCHCGDSYVSDVNVAGHASVSQQCESCRLGCSPELIRQRELVIRKRNQAKDNRGLLKCCGCRGRCVSYCERAQVPLCRECRSLLKYGLSVDVPVVTSKFVRSALNWRDDADNSFDNIIRLIEDANMSPVSRM